MRHFSNWIEGYLEHTQATEAPAVMHFWTAISTISGALRRRVWFDQAHFKWYPNLYIILVAPPGVVAKTTTAGIGMSMLREIPGINFGPEVVTWQSLVQSFSESAEEFSYNNGLYLQSALTIESGEFGNLLDPQDTQMVDMLTNLWDNKPFTKQTKKDGSQEVKNPSLNLIACTTPSWLGANIPDYMIGGGFTSRCLFIYTETKAQYIAYPWRHVKPNFYENRSKLVIDLAHIASLAGPYKLTNDAIEWGEAWYERFLKTEARKLDPLTLSGYINRKQAMVHKVAMCLSASQRDELILDTPALTAAERYITELEANMPRVFAKIGQTALAQEATKILTILASRGGRVPVADLYSLCHHFIPDATTFTKHIFSLRQAQKILPADVSGDVLLPKEDNV